MERAAEMDEGQADAEAARLNAELAHGAGSTFYVAREIEPGQWAVALVRDPQPFPWPAWLKPDRALVWIIAGTLAAAGLAWYALAPDSFSWWLGSFMVAPLAGLMSYYAFKDTDSDGTFTDGGPWGAP